MSERQSVLAEVASRHGRIEDLRRKGGADSPELRAGRRLAYPLGKEKLGYSDPSGGLLSAGGSAVNDAEMSATFIITKLIQDRDGDVVDPSGISLENYRLSPVVFFGHQSIALPIGVAENPRTKQLAVTLQPDQAISTCYFDQGDPDAVFIYGKVKRGILRMSSIGFVPLRAERIQASKAKPDRNVESGTFPGWHFYEIDLLEWSVVGVPSNPRAMNIDPKEAKHISPQMHKAVAAMCDGGACSVVGGWGGDSEGDMSKKWRKASRAEHKDGLNESTLSGGGATVLDDRVPDAGTDVQCVHVPKSLCPAEADAKKYLEMNNLSANQVSEQGDAWEAVQFSADGCVPDTSREVELKDGVTATVCQARTAEAPESAGAVGKSVPDLGDFFRTHVLTPNGDGTMSFKPAGEKHQCGCHNKNGTSTSEASMAELKGGLVTKDDDTAGTGTTATTGATESADAGADADTDADGNMPHGAQVATDILNHFTDCQRYVESTLPQMDPTKFRDYLGDKFAAALADLVGGLRSAAQEVYPDVDFGSDSDSGDEETETEAGAENETGDADNAETPEDDKAESPVDETDDEAAGASAESAQDDGTEEDEDRKKKHSRGKGGKFAKRYLSRACRGQIKEAADHLDAAADHEMTDLDHKGYAMMRSAHRYHAKALRDLADMEAKEEAEAQGQAQDAQGGDMDPETEKAVMDRLAQLTKRLGMLNGTVN